MIALLEHQVAICEENKSQWIQLKTKDVRGLLDEIERLREIQWMYNDLKK